MDKIKLSKPEDILRRVHTRKDIPEPELEAARDRLRKPVADARYEEKSGIVELHLKGHMVRISYEPHPLRKHNRDYKIITEFSIDINGERKDILALIPDYEVWLIVAHDMEAGSATHGGKLKMVNLIGDVSKPLSLLLLLHEIGHAIDNSNRERLGRETMLDSEDKSGLAEDLRQERFAAGFALKIVRPLFDRQQMKDAVTVTEHDGLKSYYDAARAALEMK